LWHFVPFINVTLGTHFYLTFYPSYLLPFLPSTLLLFPYQGYVLSNLDSGSLKLFHSRCFQTENSGSVQNCAHFVCNRRRSWMKFSILPFFLPERLYYKRMIFVKFFLFVVITHFFEKPVSRIKRDIVYFSSKYFKNFSNKITLSNCFFFKPL